jgi:hypothetical protein
MWIILSTRHVLVTYSYVGKGQTRIDLLWNPFVCLCFKCMLISNVKVWGLGLAANQVEL